MHFSTAPSTHPNTDGCGSSNCGCISESTSQSTEPDHLLPLINGVALLHSGETCDLNTLRERAYAELLRQEAVRHGLLHPMSVTLAPALTKNDEYAIDGMLKSASATMMYIAKCWRLVRRGKFDTSCLR
jgi:peptidyl-prolyl cis-trans isomerase C